MNLLKIETMIKTEIFSEYYEYPYQKGATIPNFVSLSPIFDFPLTIILESQHIASKHPPAGA